MPDGAATTFVGFYRAEYSATVRLAYVLCGSTLLAEDLTQDAFLRVEPHFGSVDNPRAYLRKALVRLCIDLQRRERRGAELTQRLYRDRSVEPYQRELFDVLERLPEKQRIVLTLRYWLDLTFVEIAAALGCRASTAKTQARRGLASIRKMLEDGDD